MAQNRVTKPKYRARLHKPGEMPRWMFGPRYSASKPMPCAGCGGRCEPGEMKMPDGRIITGAVCTKCGHAHDAHGPS